MNEYENHFCKGEELWKDICFECKYPRKEWGQIIITKNKELLKLNVSYKKLEKDSLKIEKELTYYKDAHQSAIRDILSRKKDDRKREEKCKTKISGVDLDGVYIECECGDFNGKALCISCIKETHKVASVAGGNNGKE